MRDRLAALRRCLTARRPTPRNTSPGTGPRSRDGERPATNTAAASSDDPLTAIELLDAQEDWQGSIRCWEDLGGPDRDRATSSTYTAVARAYRAVGDYERAIDVAEAGLSRWPRTRHIIKELYKSRAATADWSRALSRPRSGVPRPGDDPTAVPPVAAATSQVDDTPVGDVDDLGSLSGGRDPITGWVRADASGSPAVSLYVNDLAVATTHAAREAPTSTRCAFAISCEQVREYLGDGDVVSVRSRGRPLLLEGDGVHRVVTTGYPSRHEALAARIEAGAVFIKTGKLRRGNTPGRKREILDKYEEVATLIEEHTGHTCTPFYGNLLGAVRERDFIAHDVGGFDMGYVSRHRDPERVRSELLDVCRMLLANGRHLRLSPWSVMVREQPDDNVFLDINFGWFDERGLGLSYGWRHPRITDEPAYRAERRTTLADREVVVPGNAEAVLEQIYGPTWRIPDQGFDLAAQLQWDAAYLLSVAEIERLRDSRPDQVAIDFVNDPSGAAVRYGSPR